MPFVTAPLEIPTLLFGGAAFALTHGISALNGADGELARLQRQEEFRRRFGFDRSQLLWALQPISTMYWYIAPGDTVPAIVARTVAALWPEGGVGQSGAGQSA